MESKNEASSSTAADFDGSRFWRGHSCCAKQQPAGLFVGNNWDGTVTVIRSSGDFGKIGVINMIPDRKERLLEIHLNPVKLIAYTYIQSTAGEGHDQLVDDMYSTPDGKSVVASRPSFADVVSINIATGKINWRTPVEGFRADHMAVSPNGQQVAVSASSGNVVQVLDINSGKELGRFATGDKPHENIYFDGGKILNSAIGNVETSMDASWQDFTKGKRYLTIADAGNFNVLKKLISARHWMLLGAKTYPMRCGQLYSAKMKAKFMRRFHFSMAWWNMI